MDKLARAARNPSVLATGVDDALLLATHQLALVQRVNAQGLDTDGGVRRANSLLGQSAVAARAREITADPRDARRRTAGAPALVLALCGLLRDVHNYILRRARGEIHEASGATVAVEATKFREVARRAVSVGPLVAARAYTLRGVTVDLDRVGVVVAINFQVALAAAGTDGSLWAPVAVDTAVPDGARTARVTFPEVAAHALARF